MRKIQYICHGMILIILASLSPIAHAVETNATPAPINSDIESVRQMIRHIVFVNEHYKKRFNTIISESTLQNQQPHATVVLCSDSRVDSEIISDSPVGELFVVRDIGNQLKTAYGSVQYGVVDLHTPY